MKQALFNKSHEILNKKVYKAMPENMKYINVDNININIFCGHLWLLEEKLLNVRYTNF